MVISEGTLLSISSCANLSTSTAVMLMRSTIDTNVEISILGCHRMSPPTSGGWFLVGNHWASPLGTDSRTGSAKATLAPRGTLPCVGVLWCHQMSALTNVWGSCPSILGLGDGAKVIGAHAPWIMADVINDKVGRDDSMYQRVTESMSRFHARPHVAILHCVGNADISVSKLARLPSPFPAVVSLDDMRPETLNGISIVHHIRIIAQCKYAVKRVSN